MSAVNELYIYICTFEFYSENLGPVGAVWFGVGFSVFLHLEYYSIGVTAYWFCDYLDLEIFEWDGYISCLVFRVTNSDSLGVKFPN